MMISIFAIDKIPNGNLRILGINNQVLARAEIFNQPFDILLINLKSIRKMLNCLKREGKNKKLVTNC